MISLNKLFFISLIGLNLFNSNVNCLYCYECNTLLSAGCENPIKSGSYFYVKCHSDNSFCIQKTTTDINGMSTYMERMCAPECGEVNMTNYDRETITDICCEEDGCNHSNILKSNLACLVFALFSLFCLIV